MRKFGCALLAGVILLMGDVVPAQEGGFQVIPTGAVLPVPEATPAPPVPLDLGTGGASDIVVTDPDGRVLESWRGELRLGDVVRLGPAGLTPANALPWGCLRLRPDRALSGLYTPPESLACRGYYTRREGMPPAIALWPTVPAVADTKLRFVLFLRNEGTTGVGAIWMPAAAPPTPIWEYEVGWRFGTSDGDPPPRKHRRLPSNTNADFTTSIAWMEAGRVLVFQRLLRAPVAHDAACGVDPAVLMSVAINVTCFKQESLALPTPPPFLNADLPVSEVASALPKTAENPSDRIWTDIRK